MNTTATRQLIVHPGYRGAIVTAPDHDLDGDGYRDPAFLSLERSGRGIVASVMVRSGAPSGNARVDVHALDVTSLQLPGVSSLPRSALPQLARLQPLQDAPIRGHHVYVAHCFGAAYLIALSPAPVDSGRASGEPHLLAREPAFEVEASGDLDGDGMGDLVIHTSASDSEPRRLQADEPSALGGAPTAPAFHLAHFPGWRAPPSTDSCYPAGDIDGDGRYELVCLGQRPTTCTGDSGCRELITTHYEEGGVWGVGRTILGPGRDIYRVLAVGDVSGDEAGDWVVASPPNARWLMTSLQQPTPRSDLMYAGAGTNALTESQPHPFSREECLGSVIADETDASIVGDLDGDGRDDLGVVESSVCRDVGWKFMRFSLRGSALRTEHQQIGSFSSARYSAFLVRRLTATNSSEVFWIGSGSSNAWRLRQSTFRRLPVPSVLVQSSTQTGAL